MTTSEIDILFFSTRLNTETPFFVAFASRNGPIFFFQFTVESLINCAENTVVRDMMAMAGAWFYLVYRCCMCRRSRFDYTTLLFKISEYF